MQGPVDSLSPQCLRHVPELPPLISCLAIPSACSDQQNTFWSQRRGCENCCRALRAFLKKKNYINSSRNTIARQGCSRWRLPNLPAEGRLCRNASLQHGELSLPTGCSAAPPAGPQALGFIREKSNERIVLTHVVPHPHTQRSFEFCCFSRPVSFTPDMKPPTVSVTASSGRIFLFKSFDFIFILPVIFHRGWRLSGHAEHAHSRRPWQSKKKKCKKNKNTHANLNWEEIHIYKYI